MSIQLPLIGANHIMSTKGRRRVLGSIPQEDTENTPKDANIPIPDPEDDTLKDNTLVCPMCNEPMISVRQLNQHVDDVHLNAIEEPQPRSTNTSSRNTSSPSPSPSKSLKSPAKAPRTPTRKNISLDLFDGSTTFSLSDGPDKRSPTPLLRPRVSRTHWVQPLGNNICNFDDCTKVLNVKNGIVNCRKCGQLYCNEHTDFKVKLRNPTGDEKVPQYDRNGIMSKCCQMCYFNKPDLIKGTDGNLKDLTDSFKTLRKQKLEMNQLICDKLIRKFIKLVNLLCDVYYNQRQETSILSYFQPKIDNHWLQEKQREIVGYDNWQDDKLVNNCYICMVQFNIMMRKHHCRLCGKVVCDDKFSERQDCSLLVPLPMILSRLENLNYSLQVKQNISQLLKSHSELFLIRMCKHCKDNLLYDYKLKTLQNQPQVALNEIFDHYNRLVVTKQNIDHLLRRYQQALNNKETNDLPSTNKVKDRIMFHFKEFESGLTDFKSVFFNKNDVKPEFSRQIKILKGINLSMILFLQENLVLFKDLNNELKALETSLIPKEPIVEQPRLTKKQIRELREQLMVMNEQKFILENLINDVTKQRKFDELQPLLNNKSEILNEIKNLESELGEFGFL